MSSRRYRIDIQVDAAFANDIDDAMLAEVVSATLTYLERPASDLTVVVADDLVVQQFNRQYRDIDAPTDVLSFAAQEQAPDGPTPMLPEELLSELGRYLGDLLIAYPFAERQAAEFGNSVQAELNLLAVHGTLHLLGYDHADSEGEAAMWALQEAILAPFGAAGLTRRNYA